MTREELVKRGRTRIRARHRDRHRARRARGLGRAAQEVRHDDARAGARSRRSATRRTASSSRRSSRATGRQRSNSRARRRREGDVPAERRARRRRATGSGIPIYARDAARDREGRSVNALRRRARPEASSRASQKLGGFLTLDDLKKNQPTWVTPISAMFKGYRVWELPPNNQGIATLEMLRILEPYDLKAMGHQLGDVSASSHRGEEARVRRSRAVRRRRGSSHAHAEQHAVR